MLHTVLLTVLTLSLSVVMPVTGAMLTLAACCTFSTCSRFGVYSGMMKCSILSFIKFVWRRVRMVLWSLRYLCHFERLTNLAVSIYVASIVSKKMAEVVMCRCCALLPLWGAQFSTSLPNPCILQLGSCAASKCSITSWASVPEAICRRVFW